MIGFVPFEIGLSFNARGLGLPRSYPVVLVIVVLQLGACCRPIETWNLYNFVTDLHFASLGFGLPFICFFFALAIVKPPSFKVWATRIRSETLKPWISRGPEKARNLETCNLQRPETLKPCKLKVSRFLAFSWLLQAWVLAGPSTWCLGLVYFGLCPFLAVGYLASATLRLATSDCHLALCKLGYCLPFNLQFRCLLSGWPLVLDLVLAYLHVWCLGHWIWLLFKS